MRRCLVVLCTLAFLATACHGHASSAPTPDAAVTGFSMTPEGLDRSFSILNQEALFHPKAIRAAAMTRIDEKDPAVRFAAIYALGLTAEPGPSEAALVPLLDSDDVTERLLAAAALVHLGNVAGIPVLIDALGSDAQIAFWEPPVEAWAFVRPDLLRTTGKDFGLSKAGTAQEAAATQAAWERWWADDQDTFSLPSASSSAP